MRIFFDQQVFTWQRFGGISRYFAELMKALPHLGAEVAFPNEYTDNLYLTEILGMDSNPFSSGDFKGKKIIQNYLGSKVSKHALQKGAFDVFHPTYYDDYFLPLWSKKKFPFVVTVHDMIHELSQKNGSVFSLDRKVIPGKRQLTAAASAIIAVSEVTKRDLLATYPDLDPDKIHVVHHGCSLSPNWHTEVQLELPEEFILFIGTRSGYKNFSKFVEQIAPFLAENADYSVVCAGSGPFSALETEHLQAAGLENRFLHVAFNGDRALAELYHRALCFVFPSLYEGFGIPILESFACGCPCVLTDIPVFKEVAGDAAFYYDPTDDYALSVALSRALDQSQCNIIVEKGFHRLEDFSWRQSAQKHLDIYQKIA